MRSLLQVIGLGCLLAAAILYVVPQEKNGSTKEAVALQQEIKILQEKLTHTEQALAAAQMTSLAPPENSTETKEPDEVVKGILTIEQGSNSTIVANRLVKMGMVENANEFESFLQQQGLSGKIQIGEYEIKSSMTIEEIAALITK